MSQFGLYPQEEIHQAKWRAWIVLATYIERDLLKLLIWMSYCNWDFATRRSDMERNTSAYRAKFLRGRRYLASRSCCFRPVWHWQSIGGAVV